ncbi:DUF4276 family protein [candidate division KSB1 bacterium]|nr:DUF4276 family protein [candidate division KSB1 bacterium]
MMTVAFFLEEPSAQEMLEQILPKIFPKDVTTRFVRFRGKQDLEKNLVKKIKGWQVPNTKFVILRDQDSGDCIRIKTELINLCHKAGKSDVLVRIACRELESFYLGDLYAIENAFELKNLSKKQNTRKFRDPDRLGNPSKELLRLTQHKYQKVKGSRAISRYLNLKSNRSKSFNHLISGLKRIVEL